MFSDPINGQKNRDWNRPEPVPPDVRQRASGGGTSRSSQVPPTEFHTDKNPDRAGGPRTAEGKKRSSSNALKHGLSAMKLLDPEEHREYRRLRRQLRNHFEPVGIPEEYLVEKVAYGMLRSLRVLKAENAEILSEKRFNSRTSERNERYRSEAATAEFSSEAQEFGLISRKENPYVAKKCAALLTEFQTLLRVRGFDRLKDEEILAKVYGKNKASTLHVVYEVCSSPKWHIESEQLRALKSFNLGPDKSVGTFVKILDEQIEELKREERKSINAAAAQSRLDREVGSIPEAARLDRILRYQSMVSREIDQTLKQLEQLQSARRAKE